MIILEICRPMVGQVQTLVAADVENWADVIDLLTVEPCPFTLDYAGVVYTGVVGKATDGVSLLAAFDDTDILLPSGMCMEVDCNQAEESDCPNVPVDLEETTRLAVVGEEGCPIGYVTMASLCTYLLETCVTVENLDLTLCDLIPGGQIPEGNLVAQDRILTTSDGCDLKSVPQTDIHCPDPE